MLIRSRTTAACIAVCVAAACGPLHRSSAPRAAVVFVNQSMDQADVYAVAPGEIEVRIGTVPAGRTETLTVPSNAMAGGNTVNVVARILARSRAPRTGPITLETGHPMQVTLPVEENTLTVLPAGTSE